MGIYLRKSIKVGPLRFNLSSSGVGISAGIKGLRVGTGPRGNYVHMGRHGIYYRATIPPSSPKRLPGSPSPSPIEVPPTSTHDPLKSIESAPACQVVDSSSAALLKEIDEKRRRVRLWPFALSASAVGLLAATWSGWSLLLLAVIAAVGFAAIAVAYRYDQLSKTVVLFYSFDPELEQAYAILHESAQSLAQSARVWHIEAEARVRDRKYHAGASSLVRRQPTFVRKTAPPYLKTNVETIAIGVGRQTLHFFPDRVLIYDSSGVGAASYRGLRFEVQAQRFIEDGPAPNDATVVDRTWRYVNKKGGPDRRFKNNRQLPICLYDEIHISSASGLNDILQVSRSGVGSGFVNAVQSLTSKIPADA